MILSIPEKFGDILTQKSSKIKRNKIIKITLCGKTITALARPLSSVFFKLLFKGLSRRPKFLRQLRHNVFKKVYVFLLYLIIFLSLGISRSVYSISHCCF